MRRWPSTISVVSRPSWRSTSTSVAAIHVGVGLDGSDEARHAPRGLLQLRREAARRQRRGDPAERCISRRPGQRGDAAQPVLVDAGGGQRLGEPPRLRHAERLEALEQRILGVGGIERVQRGAARRALDRLRVQRDEPGGILALDAGLDEASQRRADDVDRLHHLIGGAPGSRRGIVELVRQARGHRAERRQPLAVLLDRRDAAHDGRNLLHHAPVHGGLGERQARGTRPGSIAAEAAGAVSACMRTPSAPSRERSDGAHPGRRELAAAGLDVIAGDEERLHRALEQEEHAGRRLAVLGEDLARLGRPRPRDRRAIPRAARHRGRRRGRSSAARSSVTAAPALMRRRGTDGSARPPSSPRRPRSRRA